MRAKRIILALAACTGLVACGDDPGEQLLYGAGAGYLGAAVLDTNRGVGAAAGAAANLLYCQEHPEDC
ncbi:hypothetical protein [Antarcticimicrobium luteum]|uniref:Uncharacterized protein n=1 Tax=Antarcticimicrobium luteum TaxID=2547397 RepID=A0A4R5UPW5_9RHOB|nr:hypothetical protein [Antarcticimicrobium luteum]TDK41052.1 hypothetical protein E1832_20340 [Antarcticimicrobium luteum]